MAAVDVPSINVPSIPSVSDLSTVDVKDIETNWVKFTQRYEVISADDSEMKYHSRKKGEKTSVQWGQRKRVLSIVQFLTNFWDPATVPDPILLYIGAAPGTDIEYVMTILFPSFTTHLYDPREMKVTPTDKMVIHKQLFTETDARQWSMNGINNRVFLMSDIRSVDSSSTSAEISEKGIWNDMLLQAKIYEMVRPVKASFKFRLPYYIPSLVSTQYVEYPYGLVYRGIWAPQSSTETRMVPMANSDGVDRISWDFRQYEDQMFHHNAEVRENVSFLNPLVDENDPIAKEPIDGTELTNDFDSVAETIVWRDYLKKIGGDTMVTLDNVRGLSRALTKFLAGNRPSNDMITLARMRKDPLLIKRKFFK